MLKSLEHCGTFNYAYKWQFFVKYDPFEFAKTFSIDE